MCVTKPYELSKQENSCDCAETHKDHRKEQCSMKCSPSCAIFKTGARRYFGHMGLAVRVVEERRRGEEDTPQLKAINLNINSGPKVFLNLAQTGTILECFLRLL